MGVQTLAEVFVFISFGYTCGSRIAGFYGNYVDVFEPSVFHSGYITTSHAVVLQFLHVLIISSYF
jgi:hypothetical protein